MKTMIDLKPSKKQSYIAPKHAVKSIRKSLPFIESIRGFYTHRVKHVDLHTNYKNQSHFAIKTWCGMAFCNGGSGKGQTYFTEKPTGNRPICATCEGRYIGAGMDGDREINGRKVMYMNH